MLWVDCSFGLTLCTENKCFPTIYYVLVELENLAIPLSDTSKSMVKSVSTDYQVIIVIMVIIKNYL